VTELHRVCSLFNWNGTLKNVLPFSVVPFEKIDKSNFLTISSHGVLQHYPGGMAFTPLDVWEREYDNYCKLMKVYFILISYIHKIQVSV
jgi:hypothetical protein